jgi:hypothetical protein
MRTPLILSALLSLALMGGSAGAASHGAAEPKAVEGGGQYVDISPVGLPVVYERRLINYVFVSVRVNLVGSANVIAMREKEPYFRDALVRLGHRRPFTRLDDFTTLDEAAIRAALTPEVTRIAGPRLVTGVQVTSQAAQKRMGLPKPPQARAPGGRPAPASH